MSFLQMDGYDDLGPPTDRNELALEATIAGGRELDDGGGMMDIGGGDVGPPEFEAEEFNDDFGALEAVRFSVVESRCFRRDATMAGSAVMVHGVGLFYIEIETSIRVRG